MTSDAQIHMANNVIILQLAMLGLTQEMIGSLLNLSHQAINQRFEQEIRNCEKLAESKLKLKNPADLARDADTPVLDLRARTISSQSLCGTATLCVLRKDAPQQADWGKGSMKGWRP